MSLRTAVAPALPDTGTEGPRLVAPAAFETYLQAAHTKTCNANPFPELEGLWVNPTLLVIQIAGFRLVGGQMANREKARPGDWTCPTCNDLQFARNAACRRCGGAKPSMETMGQAALKFYPCGGEQQRPAATGVFSMAKIAKKHEKINLGCFAMPLRCLVVDCGGVTHPDSGLKEAVRKRVASSSAADAAKAAKAQWSAMRDDPRASKEDFWQKISVACGLESAAAAEADAEICATLRGAVQEWNPYFPQDVFKTTGIGLLSPFSQKRAMWTFLVLALVSHGAATTKRCQKNGAPVFLQFGTRFSHGSMELPTSQGDDPDEFPEEHLDVPYCYGSFGAVAAQEGESVGRGMKDATLADCQRACDSQEIPEILEMGRGPNDDCRSFFKTTSCAESEDRKATVKVVSYNLYWWNAFGLKENGWKRDGILRNIKSDLRPDTIGFQECDSPELLKSRTGLEVASKFAGAQGIMVKPEKFRVLSAGSRDLEATGRWGKRYMTWARLEDPQNQHRFWHFNTHWCVHSNASHVCDEDTRYRGAKTMVKAIHELVGSPPEPVVVTGDFNAEMDERGPQHFLKSGFKLAVNEWVDSIFYSNDWELISQGTGSAAGYYPESLEVLRAAKEQQVVLGMISNHLSFWFHKECGTALEGLIDQELLLVSSEVACSKPGPEIFQLFLERLGKLHPGLTAADCVFVDDKAENVAAAQSLGFQALLYDARKAAVGELAKALKDLGLPLP
eukprot:s1932_g3.t1